MSQRKTLFVAGTDTEVGKTCIAAAVLAAARELGISTAAVKPVAAGCDENGQNDDALALMAQMTLDLDYVRVNPVALQEAIAPHIAADHEGMPLHVSQLEGLCHDVMSEGADLTLIEGAGGWRVPLNQQETLADLACQLQLDVILVVGMRLGCINHALLSAEAISNDGLKLAGWVANRVDSHMSCYEENVATLRHRLSAPCLGEVPWIEDMTAEKVAKYLDIAPILPKI